MKNKYFGLNLPMLLAFAILVFIATYLGVLSTDLAGGVALMFSIGIILYEIGERIPIWNTYVGGGLVLAFLGTAALNYFGVIPTEYAELISSVNSKPMGVLNFFIIMLITGSLLGLNRDLMVKSFAGYIPAILGGVLGAAILGIAGGLIFGVSPADTVLKYVLPVMGGGNGAGAVPLSQIYEKVTGDAAANYYGFAISILTIANIFAIIAGGILNKVGQKNSKLTGDGKTLMRNAPEISTTEEKFTTQLKDYVGAILMALTFYQLGRLIADKIWDPLVPAVPIHPFAFMIVLVALANALGIIPGYLRQAAKEVQSFFTKNIVILVMVGVGVETDLLELKEAITLANTVMAFLIVVGAVIGSGLVGQLVGFYFVDSAVTAGLCMANRGGSGDIAVLGAADRMDLMSYAQLSSRLGGGIILVIGSILFGSLM
ncbi:2-hydroxycarboxylate transporter family protein [Peptoniphilus sp. MSJ-1]|uniref:2-hydroxycarboxylate transporter family protein n=1 Tax=Peptoniphilus ovalis TaxID=2841503 RepID=A0ABS6FIJ6_9FIRM|nr:2-hydroxycarboxylate transporter family protein [Peptoniphilus ovalis]MBU5669829.1 2-hydroxycarboxylate transporter family protein [Peptoniphilus ovalis]